MNPFERRSVNCSRVVARVVENCGIASANEISWMYTYM